jgi:hypothetical protein
MDMNTTWVAIKGKNVVLSQPDIPWYMHKNTPEDNSENVEPVVDNRFNIIIISLAITIFLLLVIRYHLGTRDFR